MKFCKLFIFILLPFRGTAQENKIEFSAGLPLFGKVYIGSSAPSKYHFLGQYSLQLACKINREENNKPSFSQSIGLANDVTSYPIQNDFFFRINRFTIHFQSLIAIPSAIPNTKILFGLGIHYLINTNASFGIRNNNSAFNNIYFQDLFASKIMLNENKTIMPNVALGLDVGIMKRWSCKIMIQQNLIDYMEKETQIQYIENGNTKQLRLSYLPTHFGIMICYLLNS